MSKLDENDASLQPGNPVGLAVGQELKRGDLVGKLGNTGNTDSPHLHFHIMSTPDPLRSNGLPFVIDKYELTGTMASMEALEEADFTIDIHDVVGNDQHVVGLIEADVGMGDRRLRYRTAEIAHMRDGQITERWAFSDDTQRIADFFGSMPD